MSLPITFLLFLLAGDFNSKIGPKDTLFTYNSDTNRNGEKLIDLIQEFRLLAS